MKRAKELEWGNLGFSYTQTPYNVRSIWRDGVWSSINVYTETTISMHMASGCLHYGQEAFEGLKAHMGVDGKVRLFRPEENALRLQSSADYLCMAQPPIDLFVDMCKQVVMLNSDYIPPYGSDGSMYLRPLLIGTGAGVGVKPCDEYTLIIFVTPVGHYFNGVTRGIKVMIDYNHDRAASHGTGHVKVGGNYASALKSGVLAKEMGYDSVLYLDPASHQYIDEFGSANFFGIKNNTYVTPLSETILPSITNKSLMQVVLDLGFSVEQRNILVDELSSFSEVGALGTAAIIAPVELIYDSRTKKSYSYNWKGVVTEQIYNRYRDIQLGLCEDTHSWNTILG